MFLDVLRDAFPEGTVQNLGLWALKQVGKSKWLAYPYFLVICGRIPKNLTLATGNGCFVTYNGRRVYSPRDGILRFIEIFQDNVYEKFGSPDKGDVVMDVGAYVGAFSIKASHLVGARGKVVAIEPAPPNIEYLERNIRGIGNVIGVYKAASSFRGKALLCLSDNSACHSLVGSSGDGSVEVQVDTLDNIKEALKLPRVDFIKMDAEGSEIEILKGAERILMGNPKLSIASYHNLSDGTPERAGIVKFLVDRGYKVIKTRGYVYAERGSQ